MNWEIPDAPRLVRKFQEIVMEDVVEAKIWREGAVGGTSSSVLTITSSEAGPLPRELNALTYAE